MSILPSLDLLEDVQTALVDELWESCKAFDLTERDTAVMVFKGILPQYPY